MKKKQVFKRVAKHLLAQDEACGTRYDCWYRHPSRVELKCAIGCLIPDKFYSEEIENKTVEEPIVKEVLKKSLKTSFTSSDIALLKDLQDVHDYQDTKDWRWRLDALAMSWFDTDLIDMEIYANEQLN